MTKLKRRIFVNATADIQLSELRKLITFFAFHFSQVRISEDRNLILKIIFTLRNVWERSRSNVCRKYSIYGVSVMQYA